MKNNNTDKDREAIIIRWQSMNVFQKAGYLFQYYKIGMAALLFYIVASVFFVRDFGRERLETGFYIMAVDFPGTQEKIEELSSELEQIFELSDKKEKIVIETGYASRGNVQNEATIQTYIRAGNVDMIIAPENKFNLYAAAGYFKTLSEAEIQDLSKKTDRFYAIKTDYSKGPVTEIPFAPHDASGISDAYGIYISEGIFKEYVLGILFNAPHPEKVRKATEYILEYE